MENSKLNWAVATSTLPQTSGDLWDWITKTAVGLIIFFLGWGLKDVKKRYDRIPELELIIVGLKSKVEELERRLSEAER